jgi:hypothetical protein
MTNLDSPAIHDLSNLEKVRKEALQKIGRNVVNFAKLEAALKLLLTFTKSAGTPRELVRKQQDIIKENSKKSLGAIAKLFNSTLIKKETNTKFNPEKLDEIHISLLFGFENDKDSKQFQESLMKLVRERNDLIHHCLAKLDITSIQNYKDLIEYLDEQHTRIIDKLKLIECFFDHLNAFPNELEKILNSYLMESPLNDDTLEAQNQDPPGPSHMPH